MEDFAKIVNSFQSLIVSAKLSILDVDWVLNTSLAPAILNWIAKILDIPIRYHGPFPSFYPYNSTIWLNFCFIWFFSSNHTERLGYHESTHKLVKVYITLCNNIMALRQGSHLLTWMWYQFIHPKPRFITPFPKGYPTTIKYMIYIN